MGRFLTAVALTLGLVSAAAAATKYYIVIDTVGNCAVVDSKPSDHAGMKVMGDKAGYASKDAADKALKGFGSKCKAVVG